MDFQNWKDENEDEDEKENFEDVSSSELSPKTNTPESRACQFTLSLNVLHCMLGVAHTHKDSLKSLPDACNKHLVD